MAGMDERVSDADREQAVAWLQDHLLAGRLTLEEFSERVDQAYAAVGQGDLDRVRSGLPATEQLPVRGSRRRPTRGGHRRDWGADVERANAPEISVRVISLFGTIDVWRVPAEMPGDYGEITRGLQARHRELPP
jgi:hypothetical protein